LDYAQVGSVERLYPEHEAEVLDQDFAAQVKQRVRVPRGGLAALQRALADASRGGILVEVEET